MGHLHQHVRTAVERGQGRRRRCQERSHLHCSTIDDLLANDPGGAAGTEHSVLLRFRCRLVTDHRKAASMRFASASRFTVQRRCHHDTYTVTDGWTSTTRCRSATRGRGPTAHVDVAHLKVTVCSPRTSTARRYDAAKRPVTDVDVHHRDGVDDERSTGSRRSYRSHGSAAFSSLRSSCWYMARHAELAGRGSTSRNTFERRAPATASTAC